MQITQNRSVFLQQDHHASATPMHWPVNSASPRERAHRQDDPMANRVHQPLVFSVDDRLAEEHLTRLDLSSKNLRRIEPLPNGINFNSLNYDQNEISRLEYIDSLPQLVQVRASVQIRVPLICWFLSQLSIAHNRLTDIRLLYRLRALQKLNLSHNLIDSLDCKQMSFDWFEGNELSALFPFEALRMLQNLVMLNISNNNLSNLSPLNACHALQSLDASCNSIQQIEDLSYLTSLKVNAFWRCHLQWSTSSCLVSELAQEFHRLASLSASVLAEDAAYPGHFGQWNPRFNRSNGWFLFSETYLSFLTSPSRSITFRRLSIWTPCTSSIIRA